MSINKKGFTLPELLVVVLIIGILAAVAIPQYQLAVYKTKFAKLQSVVKVIADAYQRYYLVADDYPNDISKLDIDLPGEYTLTNLNANISCRSYQDFYCCISKPGKGVYGDVLCAPLDPSFAYCQRLFDNNGNQAPNNPSCYAKHGDNRAEKLCKYFARCRNFCDSGAGNIMSPEGLQSGYSSYYNK